MTIETRPYHLTREQLRGINLIQGIVLHEVNEGAAFLDGRMQTPLPFTDIAHQSYHYAVDANAIRAYVPIAKATFAIGDLDTMSPWTVALANPGIDPDLYTVNVAVLIGTANLPNPCLPGCGREYPPTLLTNLQELLAYIAEEAGLDLETPNIVWKHGTELCDLDLEPLLLPIEEPDPGQSDWLCDRLADLPVGQSDPTAVVGTDCVAYTPAQVVEAGLCDALEALEAGESEAPMLVGSDCGLYPMPVFVPDTDWTVATLGGRHTPASTAAGQDAFAAGNLNTASGPNATVGGGTSNTASAASSTVGGGVSNTASGENATVGGGYTNTANGNFATVGGGANNTASYYATVGGGRNATASGSHATVGGGANNTASATYATVSGGANAVADKFGQNAHAAGAFSGLTYGDAQTSVLVARCSTANATPAELFLNGASARCTIASDTTWAFNILVVARRTDANDESAAYQFLGCIDNNAGTTALVGTVAKTVIAEDTAGWDCNVTADDTNDALIVTVTGENAKTIQWVARIELVETTG